MLGVKEIIYNVAQDDKIAILKTVYDEECVIKAKDLAYTIIGLQKSNVLSEDKIFELKQKIKDLLQGISYSLEKQYIDDGIQDIFDEVVHDDK